MGRFDFYQNFINCILVGFFRLIRNKRANVATFFAIAALPMAIITAATVEIATISKEKDLLQSAADAAVLDNVAYGRGTDSQAVNYAQDFMRSMLSSKVTVQAVTLTVENAKGVESVRLTASGKMNAIVSGLIGVSSHNIQVNAFATTAINQTEIIFAFDSTASMADNNKMTALKQATKGVLAQLKQQDNGRNIKVGIVPFNTMVRYKPGTTYEYIDYGHADTTVSCGAVPEWWVCDIGTQTAEATCFNAKNAEACFKNLKFWYAPAWSEVINGKTVHHMRLEAHSYEIGSTGSNITYVVQVEYNLINPECHSTSTSSFTDETGTYTTTYCTDWVDGTYQYNLGQNPYNYSIYMNDYNLITYNRAPPHKAFALNTLSPVNQSLITPFQETPNFITYGVTLANGYAGPTASNNTTYYNYNMLLYGRRFTPSMPDQKQQWNGCIYDREEPYDTDATPVSQNIKSTFYTAKDCQHNLATVQPLTNDWDVLNAKVDELFPAGYTNLTIGIQQAMEALSPTAPFTEGKDFKDKSVNKIIILVTDGMNTSSRYSTDVTILDRKTKAACQNAKSLGITMYIVKLMDGNEQLLADCATILPYYFDLNSSTEIEGAFKSILRSTGTTRLTK